MGRNSKSDEALAREGIVAQRLAQGIRDYLLSLMVGGGIERYETDVQYEAKTKDGKTDIVCSFRVLNEKVPFKSVKFIMEFVHR